MEIICKACGARLTLADEKIPTGQKVHISCPKCKTKSILRTETPPEASNADVEGKKASEYEYGVEDSDLDSYEEGAKLALVLEKDAAMQEKLKRAVERLDYKAVSIDNPRTALNKLRFHQFDLIILSDSFEGLELDQSPILQYLNRLSMSLRRRIFLALLGEAFHTMDAMAAYSKSANLVLNRKDADRAEIILKKGIAENQVFYKVFTDTLKEVREG